MSKLADFSDRSLVWLIRTGQRSSMKDILTAFRQLHVKHFPEAAAYLLVRDITPLLRALMLVANRRKAPYDLLVRFDLAEPLGKPELAALAVAKAELPVADRKLFLTRNFQFHSLNPSAGDTAMAFINTWPHRGSRADAQRYWVTRHGPLVIEVGLPAVITSYTQVHFDAGTGHPDLFDDSYQGLSFETITGQRELANVFIRDSGLRRLNRTLLEDEANFTGPPLFFAFRTL